MTDSFVFVADHPLIRHKLTVLRNRNTNSKEFRELVREISTLLCYEATRGLPTTEVVVETPMTVTKSSVIAGSKLAFVPILRAGLGMVDGALTLIPSARIGHIGMSRDHDTFEPNEYYCSLPGDVNRRDVIVLDPMLATGGTACDAIDRIKQRGALSVAFICIIAAPEGLERMRKQHPDVKIYCASVDSHLDAQAYIIPGLGDAGDRIFGTK